MTTMVARSNHTISKDNFLRKFEKEDYIWIIQEQLKLQQSNVQLFDILSKTSDLESLAHPIYKEAANLNDTEFEYFIDRILSLKFHALDCKKIRNIKNDHRLFLFILNLFSEETQFMRYTKFKDDYILLIYIIYFELPKTSNFISISTSLESIQNTYYQCINKKLNFKKYINDNNFTRWSYNYLSSKSNIYDLHYLESLYPTGLPISDEDFKNKVLSYFDILYYSDKNSHEITIKALKKAWQQKCFRDKGGIKKQYHLPLTKQAKSELEKLSSFMDQTENRILEDLIHQMYLKKMCDENDKPLY